MGVASDDAEPCAVGPRLSPVAPYVQVRGRGLRRCVNSTVCGRSSIYIRVCVCVHVFLCICVYMGWVYSPGQGKWESTRGRHLRQRTA